MIELKQVCDTKNKLQRGTNLRFKLLTQDIGNVSTMQATRPIGPLQLEVT